MDDPPANGFWRIEGSIDAPLDWDPQLHPELFQIWFGGTEPVWPLSGAEGYITYSLVFTSQYYCRWHFNAKGPIAYEGDPWHRYFCPPADWWSHPDEGTPTFRRTWVQGYKWVEWGGGWALVMFDEDWSYSPKNYADGIPRLHWNYGRPYYPYGPLFYWAWTNAYIDLTD